ncbi:LysR substrate-binding domain-containing protein [Thioclava sp. FR2]|uniref:LysR substrate-binding domain-containing protein n=1 Tax=Thioclava sp. FR2 TaxID=3445780 RepID=UPI003EB95069
MGVRFTLRQLEYLVAVGEAGSIAIAAERVGVSSPSISVAIGQIEKQLGLVLFVRRHAQGVSLTQSGRQIIEQARVILAEAERMSEIAGTISGVVRGTLHVGCLLTFAQVVLPRLRRGFVEAHPEVIFRQSEGHQDALFEALRQAEIDIALTYDLDIPDDLVFQPLASLPPHVVLPADHPLAERDGLTLQDLAAFPMVLLDLPHSAEYFLSGFREAGLRPLIAERTADIQVLRSLVANGFGYSIANLRPRSDRSPDGLLLKIVPLFQGLRPMRLGLLQAEGAGQVQTIRAFAAHVETNLAAILSGASSKDG